ncbi:acyltransferase [Pseudomonas gingeri]|uniref:acyltransferase family protein n=1 Tax=Pseudomonas gingeri TaxID=117681 RepID=UPI0015A0808B|nr:acyltransferase [Pseudomonas gingeri]NWA28731.1 acyltransferase [Pseudomonas gingeri]
MQQLSRTHNMDVLSSLSKLTFTRFIAALMVVAFHFGAPFYPFNNQAVSELFRQGPKAVEYFFLLSGFVLSVVYSSNEPGQFKIGTFWIARFARIYPLYLLGLIFSYYLGVPEHIVLALNVTLTQAWWAEHAISMNNPGWSLSAEAFFYLMFPLFIFVLTKKRLPMAVAISLFSYLVLEYAPLYVPRLDGSPLLYKAAKIVLGPYFPIRNLPFFMVGASLGALLKFGVITPNALRFFKFPAIYAVILFAWFHYTLPFIVVPFCALILSLMQSQGRVIGFLSGRTGVLLGESSYAVYILHYPLYVWYLNFAQPTFEASAVVKFYIYVIALIVLSIFVFFVVETPCRKAIRWLGSVGNKGKTPEQQSASSTVGNQSVVQE